jgi:hypothetical protein
MMTDRPSTSDENFEFGLSGPDSTQKNELIMAQMIAHFCHTNHQLFAAIEDGLIRLKHNQPFDQKSLALIEMLIKACERGNEVAVQMLTSSRRPKGLGVEPRQLLKDD